MSERDECCPRRDVSSAADRHVDFKADLGMILPSVVQKMGYDRPTDDQKKAVEAFVLGKDVFISLPTGSGKSLCYACLSHVFDELQRRSGARECMVHH